MTDAPRPAIRQRSPLQLRRPAEIAWAFVLGPAAGLTIFFILTLLNGILDPRHALAGVARLSLAFFYIYSLIFGGFICLVVELAVVTPLLLGFHRYRWRWLNGWTGALIGFALGFVPLLLIVTFAPPAFDEEGGVVMAVGGHWTAAGWRAALLGCAEVGVVGLVAAGVFRLLAVRRVDDAEGAS
jgi:hypothetical protein